MVYFGISIVRSSSAIFAWQESREVASSPHALSSMSSSFSCAGSSESKPLRTSTWQVVHAACFSQACSMSMWCSSSVSQIDLPGSASISAPWGQMAWPGSTLSFGTSEGADLPSSKRAADALVHAPRREIFGRAVERFDRLLDRAVVRPGERLLQLGDARADARALLRGEQSAVRCERRTRRFQQPL